MNENHMNPSSVKTHYL